MNQYRVGLIGLGQIAAGYGSPGETAPYCHTGGIAQSDKVQLVAAVEPSAAAQETFAAKWGPTFSRAGKPLPLYTDTASMLAETRPDIVGVCVRGPLHYSMVRQFLESPHCPRSLFLEKPPFSSLEEADEIVQLANSHDVTITVSYSRHWVPKALKLEQLVRDGLIGRVYGVVGFGAGAILSDASHLTDLICQFACAERPAYDPVRVTAHGLKEVANSPVPPEFAARGFEREMAIQSVAIEFSAGVHGLQIGQRGEGNGLYVDIFGEKGRLRAGTYLEPAAFDLDNRPIDLDLDNFPADTSAFHVAYNQIAAHLDGGPLPACSGDNWQKVNEIGFAAIESANRGEAVNIPNSARGRQIFANG